jgi:membrane-associated protease RseP (regulator of RpoE activity)
MVRFLCVFLFLSFLLCEGPSWPAPPETEDSSCRVQLKDGMCEMAAHDVPLKYVLKALREECGVTVSGLETRKGERVTIAPVRGTRELVVKALLGKLEENNYLFQYSEDQLTKAAVLSSAKASPTAPQTPEKNGPARLAGSSPASSPPPPPPFSKRGTVVAVQGVIAGSQAEDLGLKDGDIIVQYDGLRIESASQLINRVKEKSPEDSVEMLVLRDGQPMQFTLKGGQIGVQIHTISVPEEDLKGVFPAESPKERPRIPPALRTF